MPSDFELAMQDGVKALTQSAFGRTVLYRQGVTETQLQAAWREGDGITETQLHAIATVFISDISGQIQHGDEIESDGNKYAVRSIFLDGVGGARLGLRRIGVVQ